MATNNSNTLGHTQANDTSIEDIVNVYRKLYTDTCFRRTGAYCGTMPVSFENWLRAVELATPKNGGRVKANVISGIYATKDKASDSSYVNLASMSCEPHPLIQTSTVDNPYDIGSNKDPVVPLISEHSKFVTAQRYARIALSPLGKLAVQHYRGTPLKGFTQHKSIVPTSLFRTTTPWTLGFHSQMRPICPAEAFTLQALMIDRKDFDNTKLEDTPDLLDADIQAYYKSGDLGMDYIVFMTSDSLISEYASGVSAYTVVPDIDVDLNAGTIIIKKPQLDNCSANLEKYFTELRINGEQNQFKTFEISAKIKSIGSETILVGVKFNTNDIQKIKFELWNCKEIYKKCNNKNVVLLPNPTAGSIPVQQEGLTYYAKLEPVKDTLWRHVVWEFEVRVETLRQELKNLKEMIKKALILEKVTRPGVGDVISKHIMSKVRKKTIYDLFKQDSTSQERKLLGDDYLEMWEVEEIFNVNGMELNGDKIAIPNVMNNRSYCESFYKTFLARINEIENELNNKSITFKKIRKQLEEQRNHPFMKRLSQVYFTKEINYYTTDKSTSKSVNIDRSLIEDPRWVNYTLPVSVFYNNQYLYRSFGRNMNIPTNVINKTKYLPYRVLNCLTSDYIGVVTENRTYYMSVAMMNSEEYNISEGIKAVIPLSTTTRIMVFVNKMKTEEDVRFPYESGYYLLPAYNEETSNYINSFKIQKDEEFVGYVYVEDNNYSCIDFRTINTMIDLYVEPNAFTRIAKSGMDYSNYGYIPLPIQLGIVLDVRESNFDDVISVMCEGETDVIKPYLSYEDLLTTDLDEPKSIVIREKSCYFFAHNLELYTRGIYLPSWVDAKLLLEQHVRHDKKFVLDENIWIRRSEPHSSKLRKEILQQLMINNLRLDIIVANRTMAYDRYKLTDLEDWEIINYRLNVPTEVPESEEAINTINTMIGRIWRGEYNDDEGVITYMNLNNIDYNSKSSNEKIKVNKEKTSINNELNPSQLQKLSEEDFIKENISQDKEDEEENEDGLSISDILGIDD